MTFTWDIGDFLGSATFTDPTTGATCVVLVSSNPEYYPGGSECLLTAAGADLVNRTGEAYDTANIMTEDSTIDLIPPMTIPYAISLIYQYMRAVVGDVPPDPDTPLIEQLLMWTSGGYLPTMATPAPPTQTTIKEDLDVLTAGVADLIEGIPDLDALVATLGGSPTVWSHADIMTALTNLGLPDYTAILDAIAAVRGTGDPDIADALSAISAVRGSGSPDIADTLSAINGLAVAQAAPNVLALLAVIAAIALAIPTGGATLAVPVLAAGGGTVGILATLFEVATIIGTLADIAADVVDIRDAVGQTPAGGPPVWPGAAGVDLGTPVALADGLDVVGPLHGVLIAITGHPAGAGVFGFGDMHSWGHAGAVAFRTDEGDYEWPISLGPENQVITPRSMAVAAGARLRLGHNYTGTLTPWTLAGG